LVEALPLERIIDYVGSKYALVVAAAKRARQLKDGAVPLVRCDSHNPLTIALHEIAAGKVIVKPPGEPGDEPTTETVRQPREDVDLDDLDLLAEEVGADDIADYDVEDEEEDEDG